MKKILLGGGFGLALFFSVLGTMSAAECGIDADCGDGFVCTEGRCIDREIQPAGGTAVQREGREMNSQCPLFLYACVDGSCEKDETACQGGTRATDHNSSRSNKTSSVAAPCDDCDDDCNGDDDSCRRLGDGIDDDCNGDDICVANNGKDDDCDDDGIDCAPANHNTSRSNKTQPIASPCPGFMCADGSCAESWNECAAVISCPIDSPILCPNGACTASSDVCVYGDLDKPTQLELLESATAIVGTRARGNGHGHVTVLKAMLKGVIDPEDEYQDGDDLYLRKRPGRTKYSDIVLKKAASLYQMLLYLEYNEFYTNVCDGVTCADGSCQATADACGEIGVSDVDYVGHELTHTVQQKTGTSDTGRNPQTGKEIK